MLNAQQVSNNSNLDYGISIYKRKLENHLNEFSHPKNEFCDFGELPIYLQEGPILNSESYLLSSKKELIDEIRYYDDLHFKVAGYRIPYSNKEINAFYKTIRCIQHNRAMDLYMDRAKIQVRTDAAIFSIIVVIIAFILYLLYKYVNFVRNNKS